MITYETATAFIEHIKATNPTLHFKIAGSYRRKVPAMKDIDFLLISKTPKWQIKDPLALINFGHIIKENNGKKYKRLEILWNGKKISCDVFVVDKENLPFALFHWTGDKGENLGLRRHAIERGWMLNQYGLWYRSSRRRVNGSENIKSEKDLYEFFGKSYKPPAERQHNKYF